MIKEYIDGLDMLQFTHITELSSYNSNYYIGFNDDILYCKTEEDSNPPNNWYLAMDGRHIYIGYSYDDNKLHLSNEKPT